MLVLLPAALGPKTTGRGSNYQCALLMNRSQASYAASTPVQALYPVGNLMRGVALPAPPVDAGLYQPGQLKVSLTGVETAPSGDGSRLLLLMRTPWPAWGLLNVTGPIVGWSFAEENPEVQVRAACAMSGIPVMTCHDCVGVHHI